MGGVIRQAQVIVQDARVAELAVPEVKKLRQLEEEITGAGWSPI
jgi:hypothetical protein